MAEEKLIGDLRLGTARLSDDIKRMSTLLDSATKVIKRFNAEGKEIGMSLQGITSDGKAIKEVYSAAEDGIRRVSRQVVELNRQEEKRASEAAQRKILSSYKEQLNLITSIKVKLEAMDRDANQSQFQELEKRLTAAESKAQAILQDLVRTDNSIGGIAEAAKAWQKSEDAITVAKAKRKDADAARAQKQAADDAARQLKTEQEISKVVDQIFRRMVEMAALRALRQMWQDAKKYAEEYYDALNEIRLVTGMTQEQANALGQQYRDLAEDLHVTSTSLITSVASLYRQGLGDDEVRGRLEQITQFATVAGIEVSEATRLMTASINNFIEEGENGGEAAQRIADTYANFGDRVATDAESIATAMTKTAASASNVGLSLEQTAAMASTILAVTQEEAESIGNALNTVISRYSRITKTGFGKTFEFDGESVNVNDVSKALYDTMGVNIFDYETRSFRDFWDVLDEVAQGWDALSDAERNYIANALAGTRQYNRILTLMQNWDMTLDLMATSYTDTGTVAQKYAVWTESVAAAQNNLTNSLEQLYSLLSGEVLKDFYNGMASLVDVITSGLEAMNGAPLKIAAVGAALLAVVSVVAKVITSVRALSAAIKGVEGAMSITGALQAGMGGWVSMLAVAVGAVTAIVGAVNMAQKARIEAFNDAADQSAALSNTLNIMADYKTKIDSVAQGANPAEDLREVRNAIVDTYPDIARTLGIERDDVDTLADSYKNLAEQTRTAVRAAELREIRDAYMAAADASDTVVVELMKAVGTGNIYGNEQKYVQYSNNLNSITRLREQQNQYNQSNNPGLFDPDVGTAWYSALWSYDDAESQIAQLKAQNDELIEEAANEFDRAKQVIIRKLLGYNSNMDTDVYRAKFDYLNSLISFEDFWGDQSLYGSDAPYTTLVGLLKEGLSGMTDETAKEYSDLTNRIRSIQKSFAQGITEEQWPDIQNQILQTQSDWDSLNESMGETTSSGLEGLTTLQSYADYLAYVSQEAEAAAENVEGLGNEMTSLNADLQATIQKSQQKREAASAASSGYRDQWMGMLESLTGLSVEGQQNRRAEGTYASFLSAAGTFMDPQAVIEWINKLYESNETLTTEMLEEFPKLAELVFAGDTATVEQLQAALEEWQTHIDDTAQSIIDAYNQKQLEANGNDLLSTFLWNWDMEGFENSWKALSAEEQKYIASSSDAVAKALQKMKNGIKDTSEEWKEFNRDLQDIDLRKHEDLNEIMDGTADAIENASKGAVDFAGSYAKLTKKAEELRSAQTALDRIQGRLPATAEEVEDAYATLASYTGISADVLRNDLSAAEQQVAAETNALSATIQYLLGYLTSITGVNFNVTGITAGLQAIAASSDGAAASVASLALALGSIAGQTTTLTGPELKAKIKADTAKKKTTSGGGGGGGGGGGSSTKKSYADNLISTMTESIDLSDHARELAQQAQSYYEVRRELQGVIRYMQIERDLVEDENETLEDYISALDAAMVKYAGNKEELAKLQAQHQEFSLRLLKNKTDVENLTKSIKAQYDAIRQMEIELRNTILQAIEDREAREERMLNGRIKMENEMLALLKKRYEKERDEILKTADLRRQALEDEKAGIDELLAARRKQEESDDRLEKIAELEAKIARISADPTRQKEAIALREQLAELRNELAWEEAENEAEAQKKVLDDQIQNIDEYKEYVEDYYEELLSNPRKLIEELNGILESSNEDIIAWLQENSEEYVKATDATQRSMINAWQDTLLDMRGDVQTYWDEVESIIAQGDEYIIEFLKEHSADYAEAGKLQAEAYVDGWMDQLEELRLAYKEIDGEITQIQGGTATEVTVADTSVAKSSGGGGGGGSAAAATNKLASGADKNNTKKRNTIEEKGIITDKSGGDSHWIQYNASNLPSMNKFKMVAYADGGLNDYTGIAMLHGTPQDPEAVLTPTQTKLFQSLVASLEQVPKFNIPYYGGVNPQTFTGGTNVGDVTVNVTVESLSRDTDIEEAADKLGNAFLKRIQRGASISGVRFGNR